MTQIPLDKLESILDRSSELEKSLSSELSSEDYVKFSKEYSEIKQLKVANWLGSLGIIGSGSMYPEVLKDHIIKCKSNTNAPFAVNLPLLYPNAEAHIETIISHKVPIVFTSAGNPKTWTGELKKNKIKVKVIEVRL